MSYCRFAEADVYIYASVNGGIECCGCSLEEGKPFFNSPTEEGMLEHIAAHREAGDHVPLDVDERLKKEISERGETCDAFVPPAQRDESVLAKNIGLPIDDEIAPFTASLQKFMVDIPAFAHSVLNKATQHLKEHQQFIPDYRSEDFFKGYTHALRELEFYNEAGRVLSEHEHGDKED